APSTRISTPRHPDVFVASCLDGRIRTHFGSLVHRVGETSMKKPLMPNSAAKPIIRTKNAAGMMAKAQVRKIRSFSVTASNLNGEYRELTTIASATAGKCNLLIASDLSAFAAVNTGTASPALSFVRWNPGGDDAGQRCVGLDGMAWITSGDCWYPSHSPFTSRSNGDSRYGS